MIVLLCAVAIGQVQPFGPIEDVAVLRRRYEMAQKAYKRAEQSCSQMQTTYETTWTLLQESEAQLKELEARQSNHRNTMADPNWQLGKELRERLPKIQADHRRGMQDHLNDYKTFLLESKQRVERAKQSVEQAKREYEWAVRLPREHWA